VNIVYDIEQKDGKLIKELYFVKYERPIRGGKGNVTLTYGTDSICAYDSNDKKVFVDLVGAKINKIHNLDTGEDYTEMFIKKHQEIERVYGYCLPFPIARRTEIIEIKD
jgi:hypothetical protein